MESQPGTLQFLAAQIEDNWLLIFWGVLLVLAYFEHRSPAFAHAPTRKSRWPTNLGLGVFFILLATLSPVTSLLAANWAQEQGYGLFNFLGLPDWLAFILGFLARSFAGYCFHFFSHKLPVLWRLHRVHHSDDRLDVTTSLRAHPLEFFLLVPFMGLVAIAFGLAPAALIAYELAESINSLLTHANIRLPERIDRKLRLVFVTPNMHTAHHSSWQPETDSNYGNLFSFWDRLLGTYTETPRGGYEGMKIGLDEVSREHAASFWWQMRSPAINFENLKRERGPD
jgi:sterol desaturase/sphingolipid hydroxylase (fatty acid hydroxylase superfamily)